MAEIVIPGGCGCCGSGRPFDVFYLRLWYRLDYAFTPVVDMSDGYPSYSSYLSSIAPTFQSTVPAPPVNNQDAFGRSSLLGVGLTDDGKTGEIGGNSGDWSDDPDDWCVLATLAAPNASFSPLPDGQTPPTENQDPRYGLAHFLTLGSDFVVPFVYRNVSYEAFYSAGDQLSCDGMYWDSSATRWDENDNTAAQAGYALYTTEFTCQHIRRRAQ